MVMAYWKLIWSWLSCCKTKSRTTKILAPGIPYKNHTYTVRRISSFGRTISKEDLDKPGDENAEISNFLSPIPCDRVTLAIQSGKEWEDRKDPSADVKHKKRWKKALSKVHKKQPSIKEKRVMDEKDNKQICEADGDKIIGNCDNNEGEGDKKSLNKEKTKAGNWNVALSAVQKKKSTNRHNNALYIPTGGNSVGSYSNPELALNDTKTLSVTKSSTDLHSMETLCPSSQNNSIWLKSQSMQDIKSMSADDLEKRSEVAKAHGIDLSLYQNQPISKSVEAVEEARQTLHILGKSDGYQEIPSGTIFFEVDYIENKKKLNVEVEKVTKLAGRGEKKEPYKFIIKLAILPGEKESYCTKVPHSIDERIDEHFTFNVKCVYGKVLRISVYDAQFKKGKYDAVGHVLFYVEDVLRPFSKLHQMKLYKQSTPNVNPGTVQLAMFYNKDKHMICITIIKVEDINLSALGGKKKIMIKVMHFSQGDKVKEKCSKPASYYKEATFNYTVSFKVDASGTKRNYVVISVKFRDTIKQDRTIGRLILGPYFFAEDGTTLTPWGKAILSNEMITHSFRLYL